MRMAPGAGQDAAHLVWSFLVLEIYMHGAKVAGLQSQSGCSVRQAALLSQMHCSQCPVAFSCHLHYHGIISADWKQVAGLVQR